jgi:hypothetical protein
MSENEPNEPIPMPHSTYCLQTRIVPATEMDVSGGILSQELKSQNSVGGAGRWGKEFIDRTSETCRLEAAVGNLRRRVVATWSSGERRSP